MKAHQKDLLWFLNSGEIQYVIPVYQRNYSWRIEHCEKLFNDICSIIDKPNQQYFLGSIVSVHNNESKSDIREILVIDGQQRLTTVTLILLALYHLIKDGIIASKYKDEQILHNYLENKYSSNKHRLRLKPIEKDNEVFQKLFETSEIVEDKFSTVSTNYKWLFKKLQTTFAHSESEKTDGFIDAMKRLFIVDIELGVDDDPQLIFESLNNSGKKLEEADLIRNCVLMNKTPSEQEFLYKTYWKRIEEATYNPEAKPEERDETTTFIWYFLIYESAESVKKSDIYDRFKKSLKQSDARTEDYLKTLLRFAEYYAYLIKPETLHDTDLQKAVIRLNKLDITTCYPLLFELFEQYFYRKVLDKQGALKCLKTIESYLFRRLIVELPSSLLNKVFPALLGRLKKTERPLNFVLPEHLAYLKEKARFPNNREFGNALLTRDIYGLKEKGRYCLEQLEKFKKKESVEITEELTIEHIMPRKLSAQWQKELGQYYEDVYQKYLNTLGNLTFTAYNSLYSNRSFSDKKTIEHGFNQSPLWLNQSVKRYKRWDEQAIVDRAKFLATEALTVWEDIPRTFSQVKTENEQSYFDRETSPEEVTGKKPSALMLFGTLYPVKSWKDVYIETFKFLLDQDYLKFQQVASDLLFPNRATCRSPHEIKQNLFLEVNRSASMMFKQCIDVMECFSDKDEDFQVYYV